LIILSIILGKLNNNAQEIRINKITNTFKKNKNKVIILNFRLFGKNQKFDDNIYTFSLTNIGTIFNVIEICKRNKPNILFCNTYSPFLIALILKKLLLKNTIIICDVHGIGTLEANSDKEISSISSFYIRYIIHLLLENIAFKYSDILLCVSNKMIIYLHKHYNVPNEKLYYLTNGVDTNLFKPSLNQFQIENNKKKYGLNRYFIFGYLGGMNKLQGVDLFTNAANSFKNDKIKYIVIGGKENILNNKIVYVKRQPQEILSRFYDLCDVLVLPRPKILANEVAAPTKFFEYLAMGKPILSTDVSDSSYYIKKFECGIVIEDNVSSFHEAFYKFFTMNKTELHRMGTNSRRLAIELFQWDDLGRKVNIFLKSMVERKNE